MATEQDVVTLAESLKRNGLAASEQDATRMAEQMLGLPQTPKEGDAPSLDEMKPKVETLKTVETEESKTKMGSEQPSQENTISPTVETPKINPISEASSEPTLNELNVSMQTPVEQVDINTEKNSNEVSVNSAQTKIPTPNEVKPQVNIAPMSTEEVTKEPVQNIPSASQEVAKEPVQHAPSAPQEVKPVQNEPLIESPAANIGVDEIPNAPDCGIKEIPVEKKEKPTLTEKEKEEADLSKWFYYGNK